MPSTRRKNNRRSVRDTLQKYYGIDTFLDVSKKMDSVAQEFVMADIGRKMVPGKPASKPAKGKR